MFCARTLCCSQTREIFVSHCFQSAFAEFSDIGEASSLAIFNVHLQPSIRSLLQCHGPVCFITPLMQNYRGCRFCGNNRDNEILRTTLEFKRKPGTSKLRILMAHTLLCIRIWTLNSFKIFIFLLYF